MPLLPILIVTITLMITMVATDENIKATDHSDVFNEMRKMLFRLQTSIVEHNDKIIFPNINSIMSNFDKLDNYGA